MTRVRKWKESLASDFQHWQLARWARTVHVTDKPHSLKKKILPTSAARTAGLLIYISSDVIHCQATSEKHCEKPSAAIAIFTGFIACCSVTGPMPD